MVEVLGFLSFLELRGQPVLACRLVNPGYRWVPADIGRLMTGTGSLFDHDHILELPSAVAVLSFCSSQCDGYCRQWVASRGLGRVCMSC